ncbi:MAG TPA: 30S ribosomal protein S12 methylthiotransferase RimO [Rhabdochlamydiaceae bacterium]|nr:30S ribosomal protein S12 methylthiotransferase RimO [Rhabdochlamydiaceae bacterium]
MQNGNKIHFTSLGCARNLVDTEVMLGIVLKAGYEIAGQMDEADYLVVNTCGFLEKSRQEARDTISHLLTMKKKAAKLIVTGCMVQKKAQEIREQFPEVHYLLGSGDTEKILEAIQSAEKGESVTSARSYLEWGEVPRLISTPKHYAYLKIAEGCAKRCSFCIIPTIKGPLKSKSIEQVLKEFQVLLKQGVFEVILIAQDLGDYGKERKEKHGFETLVSQLLKVDQKFWLRFLYLYPDEISDQLIDLMAQDQRVCPYLDMPLQHINDQILKTMRRKTSRNDIISILTKLRAKMPHVVIRTSLMVGFPGETDAQFEELVQFIQDYPIDNIGVFKFSAEQEAHASTLPNQISEEIKEARYARLMEVQMQVVAKQNRKYIGQTLKVIVEGYHPDSSFLMRGRFYGQCPEIDGQVIINDFACVTEFGQLYEVEITDVAGYDLIGGALRKINVPSKNSLAFAHG